MQKDLLCLGWISHDFPWVIFGRVFLLNTKRWFQSLNVLGNPRLFVTVMSFIQMKKTLAVLGCPSFPRSQWKKNNIFFKHVKQQKTSQEVWEHPTVNITYSSTLMVSKPFWKNAKTRQLWVNENLPPQVFARTKMSQHKTFGSFTTESCEQKSQGNLRPRGVVENLGCGTGIRSLVVNQKYGGVVCYPK